MSGGKASLEERVVRAAESALAARSFVSAIDIFEGIGWLQPAAVRDWRNGRVPCLERVTQANLSKLSDALRTLRQWALEKGLKPSETRYMKWGRGVKHELRFSVSGSPEMERIYRTHYVSPALSEKKQERLQEKLEKPKGKVVFLIQRDSACTECGVVLERGSFLTMDGDQALCLACGGYGDLVYLPAGNATMTRRAGKHSQRSAVVVQFSKSRGRYERQGTLVEVEALAKAEADCYEDADERALERERAAKERVKADARFVAQFAARIRELYPRCPVEAAERIASHTARRGSGRVGRSAAGRDLQERAVQLAVRAAVRHEYTNYDELLLQGVGREYAREAVWANVDEVLANWSEKTE